MNDTIASVSNCYRERFRQEYQRRREVNPKYTVRSFARDLSISAAAVTMVMNGDRHFRLKTAAKVASKLNWPEE